jgi:hypothetical protein
VIDHQHDLVRRDALLEQGRDAFVEDGEPLGREGADNH